MVQLETFFEFVLETSVTAAAVPVMVQLETFFGLSSLFTTVGPFFSFSCDVEFPEGGGVVEVGFTADA
jgi:hypothetical protein